MIASLSHYHIRCRDKFELARWYQAKLGFEIVNDVEALGEKDGPVFISADGGKTGIAIFSKNLGADQTFAISCIPAFEVAPDLFIEFYKKQKLETPNLTVYDHLISFSVYIADPVGTKIEILCSQYSEMRQLLIKQGIPSKQMNPSHDPEYREI